MINEIRLRVIREEETSAEDALIRAAGPAAGLLERAEDLDRLLLQERAGVGTPIFAKEDDPWPTAT